MLIEPADFLRRLELTLCVLGQQRTSIAELFLLANAGHDIEQWTAVTVMHERFGGCQQTRARLGCEVLQPGNAAAILAIELEGCGEPRSACSVFDLLQVRAHRPWLIAEIECGDKDRVQSRCVIQIILKIEPALTFRRAAVPNGQQSREIGERSSIFWIDDKIGRSVPEHQTRSDDHAKVDALFFLDPLRLHMRPHDSSERVAIGYADACQPKLSRLLHHLFRMRARAEEGKVRRDTEFGEAHANRPCTNQRGASSSSP